MSQLRNTVNNDSRGRQVVGGEIVAAMQQGKGGLEAVRTATDKLKAQHSKPEDEEEEKLTDELQGSMEDVINRLSKMPISGDTSYYDFLVRKMFNGDEASAHQYLAKLFDDNMEGVERSVQQATEDLDRLRSRLGDMLSSLTNRKQYRSHRRHIGLHNLYH